MKRLPCEIAVIGAGPAGSSAAWAAARAGASVVLIERRSRVGVPVQCAEYVPWPLAEEVPWSPECVCQRVSLMRTHLPDGQSVETAARGHMIDRARFDQHLARSAVEMGARLLLKTAAVERTTDGFIALRNGEPIEIVPQVIIGADGPRSTVGRWIGQVNRTFLAAAQVTARTDRPSDMAEIYFMPECIGGYGWRFPKGNEANVGVGLRQGGPLAETLTHLMNLLGVTPTQIVRRTGGYIPCGGAVEKAWLGNVLLVGDAAGQTHPITGAGIANACLCGKLAGQTAADALSSGNLKRLEEYESAWRDFLGSVLLHAARKRQWLESHWSPDVQVLSNAVRQTWIAFPGYGQSNCR